MVVADEFEEEEEEFNEELEEEEEEEEIEDGRGDDGWEEVFSESEFGLEEKGFEKIEERAPLNELFKLEPEEEEEEEEENGFVVAAATVVFMGVPGSNLSFATTCSTT